MKKYIVLFLLIPSIALAGGFHEKTHKTTPVYTPPPAPVVVVPAQPVPVSQPSNPAPHPVASGGGNGQIYCSGPTAPGWQVGISDGGCNHPEKPDGSSSPEIPDNLNHPTFVMLNTVPYTGTTITDLLYDLFFWWL